MLHLYDRATMARALTLDLDPRLLELLTRRIAALVTADFDLTDDTEYLIVEPGDTEAEIVRKVGFSPLVDPIDGHRLGDGKFEPFWDHLIGHEGWLELTINFGSTFAYVILIPDQAEVFQPLRVLCQKYEN